MAAFIDGIAEVNILVLTGSMSRDGGGLTTALQGLLPALVAGGDQISLHGLQDPGWALDAGSWGDLPVHAYPQLGPTAFGYSPQMKRACDRIPADLVHCHGLWKYPSLVSRRQARQRRLPVVISPHGMLNDQALTVASLKKKIALAAYERDHLMNAQCLHALVDSELDAIRRFGFTGPVCVIANGVTMPSRTDTAGPAPWLKGTTWRPEDPVLLYLGRKHPIKNLDGLLKAWQILEQSGKTGAWQLVVAGWGDAPDESDLNQLFGELSLKSAHLLGPLFGADKAAALAAARGFVLVSHGEALPVAMLEAWAWGLPAVVSRQCNFPLAFELNAAVEATTDPAGLAQSLEKFINLNAAQRQSMGSNGQTYVQQHFDWSRIAAQFHAVYEWLVHGATPPDCVELGTL